MTSAVAQGVPRMPETLFFYNHTGSVSGAEVVLLSILRRLDRTRFEPVVICPEGDLAQAVKALGVTHRSLRVVTARFSKNLLATAGYLAELIAVVREFRGLLRTSRPALLHANSIRAGLVASAAARGLGFPVLWHLHDILPDHPFSRIIRRLAQSSRGTALLAVSHATARAFAFEGGRQVVRKPVHVVYNSVDLERFQPDEAARQRVRAELGLRAGDVAIGVIAQITPRKRQLGLVEAFAKARSAMPQAKLLLVGEAQFHARNQAYAAQLREAVMAADAGDAIRLLGRRRDVPAVVNAMDIVAQNSEVEPLGLSLMEGLAAGKPCVSTGVDGTPEVVEDGVDGFLSPVDAAETLMADLLRLVNDAALRKQMGEAGRRSMERRFSPAEQMRQMHALYNQLISGQAG